jgi:hypothetical protein
MALFPCISDITHDIERIMSEAIAVGKEILAYCTSCKMDLAHIVVSMKGDRVAKGECKTCKKTHAYKAPKGVTEPPKKRARKSAEATAESRATSIEAEWQRLMAAHPNSASKNYTMKTSYRIGEKVLHKNFGDGIVGKLIFPNKIEVIFKNDIKVLIHAGAPAA